MADLSQHLDAATQKALASSFFRKLPNAILERIVAGAVPQRLPAGATLYWEGEAPRVGVVVQGLVRVFLVAPDGRQITVRYARQGELLGLPLSVSGPGNVAAQSVTPTRLLMFPVEVIRALGREDASVAWAVAEEISGNLWEVLDELAVHAFGSMRQRVARHLLDLATSQDGKLVARVRQSDIAKAVGSVREVIARTLRELKREGLIAPSRGGILILDASALYRTSRLRA